METLYFIFFISEKPIQIETDTLDKEIEAYLL